MTKQVVALVLMAWCAVVEAASGSLHRVVIPTVGRELVFDVRQSERDGGRFRTVSITCEGECGRFEPYSHETLDHILSAQFDSDARELMLVSWITGTGYRAELLSISDDGVTSHLDIGSKAPPVMANLDGDVIVLTFGVPDAGCFRAMRWNGTRFSRAELADFGPYSSCP